MAASLEGKAAVYGIDGTLAFTGLLSSVNILKGISLTESYQRANLVSHGHIIGGASEQGTRAIAWTIVPYDPSGTSTLANAKLNVAIPAQLGAITIAGCLHASASIIDGTWSNFGDVSVNMNEAGYLEISGTAVQYLQSDGTWKALTAIG
jgi:hypothetical protein